MDCVCSGQNGLRSIRYHNKLATTESQIATGGDLSFSLCVACRVNLTLNELKLVDIKKIMIILRKAKPE